MAVMKTPETKSVVENNMALPAQEIPSSPVPSYAGSQDSHSLLIPSVTQVIKEEAKPKKKKSVVFGGKVLRQRRLKNALWLLLFSSLFALVVCVVITLANSFQDGFFFKGFGLSEGVVCNPFGRCESKTEEDNKSPITHIKNLDYPAGLTQQQCIHQRALWEGGAFTSEIVHDLKTKWSALVDHSEQKCLLFAIHWDDLIGCPIEYPWFLDMRVGIPVCRTILDRIAPIRRVMRHILDENVHNLTSAGYITSRKCFKYKTAIVDKVIVQYFDINNNRVAKRSVRDSLQLTQNTPAQTKEKNEYGALRLDEDILYQTDAFDWQPGEDATEAVQSGDREELKKGNLETKSTVSTKDFNTDFYAGLRHKLLFPGVTPSGEDGLEKDSGFRVKRVTRKPAKMKNMKETAIRQRNRPPIRQTKRPGDKTKKNAPKRKPQNHASKPNSRRTRESKQVFAALKRQMVQNHQKLLTQLMSETVVFGNTDEINYEPLPIKGKKRSASDMNIDNKLYQEALQIWRRIVNNSTGVNASSTTSAGLSSAHDFVYGSLIPEVTGHWELVLSNINEDGRILLSEKFEKIPQNLERVSQFLRPLMQEVKDAIQSAVNSETDKKPKKDQPRRLKNEKPTDH